MSSVSRCMFLARILPPVNIDHAAMSRTALNEQSPVPGNGATAYCITVRVGHPPYPAFQCGDSSPGYVPRYPTLGAAHRYGAMLAIDHPRFLAVHHQSPVYSAIGRPSSRVISVT